MNLPNSFCWIKRVNIWERSCEKIEILHRQKYEENQSCIRAFRPYIFMFCICWQILHLYHYMLWVSKPNFQRTWSFYTFYRCQNLIFREFESFQSDFQIKRGNGGETGCKGIEVSSSRFIFYHQHNIYRHNIPKDHHNLFNVLRRHQYHHAIVIVFIVPNPCQDWEEIEKFFWESFGRIFSKILNICS